MSEQPQDDTSPKEHNTASPSSELEHTTHWANLFIEEFRKESDRASVIVAASIFDTTLYDLLKQHLVPNPSTADELFDGANAPLSTFSAKIAIAYRLGLISGSFARNLHLIRKIRNEFAHNIHGGSFEDTAVKSRVMELYRSQHYRVGQSIDLLSKGTRGEFLLVCSWMLWCLRSSVSSTIVLTECTPEFGFVPKDDSSAKAKRDEYAGDAQANNEASTPV